MITISEQNSQYSLGSARLIPFESKIAWCMNGNQKLIIAVGGKNQWGLSEPLPAEATLTNLISASTQNTELAAELWGSFLIYVCYSAQLGFWQRMKLQYFGIPVKLSIHDNIVKSSVQKSLSRDKHYKIKIIKD